MLYVLHDVRRVEVEVRRTPALSKFHVCQQFGVDIESHNFVSLALLLQHDCLHKFT
jgi:hypothetical protein